LPNGKLHKINPKTGQRYPPKRLSNYKKAVKLEEGLQFAQFKAQDRWKKSTKGFLRSIQDHIGKAVDRIDPLEAIAVIGMTIIVKQALDTTAVLKEKAQSMFQLHPTELGKLFGVPEIDLLGKPSKELLGLPDWSMWLVSFALAYCLIKYGGQLIGLLDKGLVPVLTLLMGA